jgi:hypothetical protein
VHPQAAVGKRQCGWTGGDCEVTVSFSWTPAGNAAGYILFFVLTEDRLDGAGTRPIIYGTRVIPASPSPTHSESFSAKGGILRACFAIIYDATNPPNPLDGECIETQLP